MTADRGDHINSQVSCLGSIMSRPLCYIQRVRRVRAVASRVALLWIVWQAGTLAATPLAIAHQAAGDALTDHMCECPDAAPGRQCPMHHHSNSVPERSDEKGAARCSMRAPAAPADLGLAAIAIAAGMLPVRIAPLPPAQFTGFTVGDSARAFTRSIPPLSPPPEL